MCKITQDCLGLSDCKVRYSGSAQDELWMHKWGFDSMETIQSEAFYRMIGRTGITYGDTFRMVKRVSSHDGNAMMR